jgi:hypothetical protein
VTPALVESAQMEWFSETTGSARRSRRAQAPTAMLKSRARSALRNRGRVEARRGRTTTCLPSTRTRAILAFDRLILGEVCKNLRLPSRSTLRH